MSEPKHSKEYYQGRVEGAAQVALKLYTQLPGVIAGAQVGTIIGAVATGRWMALWVIPIGMVIQAICFVLWRKIIIGTYGSVEAFTKSEGEKP